jgi:hypothetical protein
MAKKAAKKTGKKGKGRTVTINKGLKTQTRIKTKGGAGGGRSH